MIDPERDGFFVELSFVKTFGQGSRPAKKNPGKMAWEKMAKTKRCAVQIKNNDDLCPARAIVTMKERCDGGSQYQKKKRKTHPRTFGSAVTSRSGCSRGPLWVRRTSSIPRPSRPTGVPTHRSRSK